MPGEPLSLKELFLAALAVPPADRTDWLQRACGPDVALRQRLEQMLRAHDTPQSLLDRLAPAAEPGHAATADVAGPTSEQPGTLIGPYKLLQQIGEGGMGTVYMAEQSQPVQRKVALKIIKPGMDSRQVIARFEAERQALALMDHPNIAKVLDAGTTQDGRPFFVMELVKGAPITKYSDDRRLTTRERLELFLPVCQAIQHAHQKGIIHRDIKPSNVLVCIYDGKPMSKVIDFGVAKATGPKLTERTLYTEFGAIVGTFEYMSPEQAQLDQLDIDTRSDIYSLGVLLYELLTGTTPLERKRLKEVALLELLRLVREEEAPRPSTRLSTAEALPSIAANRGTEPKKLTGLVRGELDWIAMKALEKDRNRRYETANAFAADVQRYLHDEPVAACPPSFGYRFRKFARRNKVALAIAAATALAGVLALLGLFVSYAQIAAARHQADDNADHERAARGVADQAQKAAEQKAEESLQRLVRMTVAQGVRLMDEGNLLGSLPWFAEALRLDQGDPAREEIHRIRLAAVLRQCPRLVQVWAETDLAEFSPDSQRVVTANRNGTAARIWDAASGQPLSPPLRLDEGVADVIFRGQRCHAVTIKGTAARVWDVVSGEPMTPPLKHDSRVKMASFSPDGSRVATWCADDTVRVWEGPSCRLTTRPLRLERLADGVKQNMAPNAHSLRPWFTPDSHRLLLLTDKQVQVWDVAEGRLITTLDRGFFFSAAWSADGRRIATGSGFGPLLHLWDVTNGGRNMAVIRTDEDRDKAAAARPYGSGSPNGMCFSSDGRHLVSASNYGTAQVWDTATWKPRAPPLKHESRVNGAWFSPDGRDVLTASHDRTACIWAAATGERLTPPLLHCGPVEGAAFSPDGHLVLTWAVAPGGAGVVRLWDRAPAETVPPHKDSLPGLDWRRMEVEVVNYADGITVARLKGQPLRVWDWVTGKPLSAPLKPTDRVFYAEFSRDRSRLMTLSPGIIAQVWDPTTGQPVGPPHQGPHSYPHLSPDGRRMVSMGRENTTQVWDVVTGAPLGPPLKSACDTQFGQDTVFSPDGRWVLIREDATVRVWDGRAPQGIFLLPQHNEAVENAFFSSDSQRLLTCSHDGSVYVWDVATGRHHCPPLRHDRGLLGAAFSTDGRLVATLNQDALIRAWDVATGEPVTPRLPTMEYHSHFVRGHVVFSPGGDHLIGRMGDGRDRQLDLAPDRRPVRELIALAEVLSGHRIDPVSGLVPLEAESFQRAWTDLRARYPQSFASSRQAALAWHSAQAAACLGHKEWATAIGHLEHLIGAEPKQRRHYHNRGLARAELKQWDRAIADYSRAIELGLGGDEYQIRASRGDAYAVQGQWDKAAGDYAYAVQSSRDGGVLGL
jgi:WD40 repeat protein/serine/threonine protein kinase